MIVPKESITPHIIDLAGGIGDILNVFYITDAVSIIKQAPGSLILLRSHNRHAKKFIQQQGCSNIFDLSSVWKESTHQFFVEAVDNLEELCKLDFSNSQVTCIKERSYNGALVNPPNAQDVVFFFDRKEALILESLSKLQKLVAIHYTAGSVDRDIPKEILIDIIEFLLSKHYVPVIVGNGNSYDLSEYSKYIINLETINATVGFSNEVIKKCSYFIGSHSSMNLVAWHNKIKSLILMPESTYHSHFFDTLEEKTVWNFGAFDLNNKVALFSNYNDNLVKEFLR